REVPGRGLHPRPRARSDRPRRLRGGGVDPGPAYGRLSSHLPGPRAARRRRARGRDGDRDRDRHRGQPAPAGPGRIAHHDPHDRWREQPRPDRPGHRRPRRRRLRHQDLPDRRRHRRRRADPGCTRAARRLSICHATGTYRRGPAARGGGPLRWPVLPSHQLRRARQHLRPDRSTREEHRGGPAVCRTHPPAPPLPRPRRHLPERRMAAPRLALGEDPMTFARPALLWLAVVLPTIIALAIVGYFRRRRRVAHLLGDVGLVARLGAAGLDAFPTWRLLLLAPAALLIGLAAAGPQWGTRVVETHGRSLDLVLVLDVSKSMLARDIEPNRLERQRLFVS